MPPTDPLAADQAFFDALLAGDADDLNELLSDDFILVDVLSGSTIPKSVLVGMIRAADLSFTAIETHASDLIMRSYEDVAVLIGHTRMSMAFGGETFSAESRYTHIFVATVDGWEMVSAQGTLIPEGAPPRLDA